MAVTFKQIQDVSDPVRSGDLVRVQQNVAAAFREVGGAGGASGALVTAGPGQYRATGAEEVIFVDQGGGAVTVVLPEKPRRAVSVRSISKSTNAITVTAPGRAPGGTAPAINVGAAPAAQLVTIAPLGLLRLAFDGTAWWSS